MINSLVACALKPLGSTGVEIPSIGFGTWRYSGGVLPLITAIERGPCFIDTAESYGSEEVVGEAIRGLRHRVFLASKARPRYFRQKDLFKAAEASLKRLRTDYLDLYQLHWPSYLVPLEETMGAMEQLVDAGKIRFIGVSNFFIRDLKKAQAALRKYRIVSNQMRYSVIDRTIESGLLQYCRENNITIVAFSPFGENFSSIKAHDPEGILPQVAKRSGKTVAQVVLNWLIAKDGIVAIPKASSVEHVIDDCGAAGWQLSEQDSKLLTDKIRFGARSKAEIVARRWARRALQYAGRQT